jgi:hypothetical protein
VANQIETKVTGKAGEAKEWNLQPADQELSGEKRQSQ